MFKRKFRGPKLRKLMVPCMGLLRFSLFEAVEKSNLYQTRVMDKSIDCVNVLMY